MQLDKKEMPIIIGAFLAIYIIWGSTYMANKIVVQELPPFFLAGIRFCVAAAIIFIVAILSKTPIKTTRERVKNAAIAGFFFLTLGNGLAVWALQYIDSGFAAVVISAQPLVLLMMMRVKDKKPIKIMSIIGIGLGMVGIWLLVSQKELVSTPNQWKGLLAISGALFTWGYGSLFVSKAELPKNQFINGAYQMAIGGFLMLLISVVIGESYEGTLGLSKRAYYALIYLIIFGSIIAFTSFNYLLVRISPEKVATSTYINPIVAMLCGWYFLDEIITNKSIMATLILLTGVYFINSVRFSNHQRIVK